MAMPESDEGRPAVAMETPLLFDGQRLDQPSFHELYLQTPEKFRAELIDGVVYLRNGRVSAAHGEAHASLIWWLGLYSMETPGTTGLGRVTILLGPRSELEPDTTLLIDPESGGWTHTNQEGLLVGSPELVVEVSDDTLDIDMGDKKNDYERAGAAEYLLFDVPHRKIRWYAHREGRFVPLPRVDGGLYQSHAFPGLWLDEVALLRGDYKAVMAVLQRGLESPEHADFVERLEQNRANRP